MKKTLMVAGVFALVMALSVSPIWACAGVHGANVASGLNALFGKIVAEGDEQDTNGDGVASGGDHKVTVWAGGETYNRNWNQAQDLYDWLVAHGEVVPNTNSNSYTNNATIQKG